MDKYIQEWNKQLVKCIRCGTCRTVCPVFQAVDNENATARGKVKLIEAVIDRKLELTPELQKLMSRCLLCKSCVPGCPSGVKTDELFLNVRKALAEANGIPLAKKLAFTGLTYRNLFDLGLQLGAVFQSVIFKDALDGKGKLPRIPLPAAGLNEQRLIPALANKPLRKRVSRVNTVENPRFRVAFFPGCMLNYVYPEAGEAVIGVLRKNDVEVVLPENVYCCDAPAFTSGDFAVGRYLAEQNIKALSAESYDAIITGCASCGASLKHEYGIVIDDPAVQERWRQLAEKVYDVTQFLLMIGYSQDFGEIKAKVTYHDPCHLVRGMGVTKEPRHILQSRIGGNEGFQ
jgi:glycolate oxidase iron-sulfur subunit